MYVHAHRKERGHWYVVLHLLTGQSYPLDDFVEKILLAVTGICKCILLVGNLKSFIPGSEEPGNHRCQIYFDWWGKKSHAPWAPLKKNTLNSQTNINNTIDKSKK